LETAALFRAHERGLPAGWPRREKARGAGGIAAGALCRNLWYLEAFALQTLREYWP